MEIHQFLAGMSYGDAISIQAMELQGIFNSWGLNSELYSVAKHINPRLRGKCRDYRTYERSSKDNIAILHLSIFSPINQYFCTLQEKKVIIYHNITPSRYLHAVNARIEKELEVGRDELSRFSDAAELVLAVSEYNRAELKRCGFGRCEVLPLTIDTERFDRPPNQRIIDTYRQPHIRHFLTVGRLAPNKRFDDVIFTFYYYNKYINSDSRLFIIGSYAGTELYHNYLRSLVLQLGLRSVYLLGHVNLDDLIAYYKLSDIFICMSEHEGFGVPLIESMYFGLPIIAYKAAAIPETLADTGVLVKERNYQEIAELANVILEEAPLRERIVARQRERLKYFSKTEMERRLRKYLGRWL